ncbi:MAG TPA: threonine synthase [Parafilimonas sp.]|nr:threonine synthase [Parafilimonas sp.]
MKYYSLNKISPDVTFKEATVKGQAPDKGLYFPSFIPTLSKDFIANIKSLSKEEIGFEVMKPFVGESIPGNVLQNIITETISFDFPLVNVHENIYALELFHGPTLAFKDVGARFMSRCLGYFNRNNDKHTTVLVATSGDTGGAVANGFLGVEGVDVIILYPSKKVSPVQELQLTTLGKNISALEINGSFDDCQAMVKQAFADTALNKKFVLTSANSINVARWLPQQLYYFYAYQQWQGEKPPVISVPSGNFGNICAGILAHLSGLPVKHFIAACNANDVVPEFLHTGNYQPKNSIATISNAMDVGNPSNFIRILELFHQQLNDLKPVLSSYSVDDITTQETIKDVYEKYNYVLDPHGAVGYQALHIYLNEHNSSSSEKGGIFLETAHPVKFPETVEAVTHSKIAIPESVEYLFDQKKQSIKMNASFNDFKEWMMGKKVQ